MIEPEILQPTQPSHMETTILLHQPLLEHQVPESLDNQKQLDHRISEYMFKPKTEGFEKLMSVKSVAIQQKLDVCHGFPCCTSQNKYQVYALSEDGKYGKGSKMFKCQEKSNFCARQCCPPQARGFNMKMDHKDYIDKNFDGELFLNFGKSFECSMLCFGRPEVEVEWNENGRKIILGKIRNPYSFCDIAMEICDALGNSKYTLKGTCCQPGVIMEGPICDDVKLMIKNESGMEVGVVHREYKIGLKNCFQAVSNFKVDFPVLADAESRALIVAATVLMNYMYFERRWCIVPANMCSTCI